METPRLELVEITDEDAFFEDPPAPELFDIPMSGPRRPWLWCGAFVMTCALAGLGGFRIGRTHEPQAIAAIPAAPPPVMMPPANCVEREQPKPSVVPVQQATAPEPAPHRKVMKPLPKPASKPGDPLTL